MAKNKTAQKSSKDVEVKSLSSVKKGAVTKPSQTPKSKSKEMAKQVAVKADKADKKSKKTKKEPTTISSSESESESDDEEASNASSASSDEEAPSPKIAKTNGVKANGVAKAAAKAEESSESSDSSEDQEDEEDEPKPAPAAAAKATVAGAKEEPDSEGTSEGTSEGSSEEDSDEEVEAPVALDAKKLNGKLEKVAPKAATSDEESGSEATSSGTSDSSSDEDDDEEEEETPAPKKRKAEADATPVSKKAKTDPGNDDAAKKNLFVGQLSWNVDEEWLTREFEGFGELASVRIVTDRETGRSRGFGYVEFVNAEDGVKAQEAMHQTQLDGRTINVDFSKPKPDSSTPRGADRQKSYGDSVSEKSETIFVANLSFEATEDVVGEEFGKHGNVLGVRLPTDMDSGAPKGFGYVQFGSVEEAEEVFGKMTGAMILGRPIRLDYSTPRPPRNNDSPGGRGRGRGGFSDRGGRGGGRGRGGFDRGGRGGGRGGFDRGRGGRGGSTNRGGFGDYKGTKKTFD